MGQPINTGLIYQNIGDKRRTHRAYGVDITPAATIDLPVVIFPVRVAIIAVRYIVTILLTTAAASVKLGTAVVNDALIAAYEITDNAAIAVTFAPTLATTLVDSAVPQALGLPIFEASTLMTLTSDDGPDTGELLIEVDFFELDE